MAVNIIVVAVTLMMGGFVTIWLACPRSRAWFEAPKQPAPALGPAHRMRPSMKS